MPIHDQGYRRYLGTRAAIGRSWQVMTRAGVMSVISKRVFLGMMLFAWAPFVVRAVQIYCRHTSRRRRSSRRRARPSASSSISRASVRLLRDHLRRRRADRQRSPRQRAAAVSVEADDERRIHRRQARHPVPLPGRRHVPAGDDAAAHAGDLRRQPDLHRATTSTWCRRSRCIRWRRCCWPSTTMLALSSLSKSSRFVAVMYAGLFFFTTALFQRAARHHRPQHVRVAVAQRGARSSSAT